MTTTKKYQAGIYNESFAKSLAMDSLKVLRYGDINKDYFWIHEEKNSKPYMVMHPFSPQLDGQDISTYKDPNGVFLFNEMNDVVNRDGSGFVQYSWKYYDDENLIEPKLSFVILFEPWNWILGTGFYIQDVDAKVMNVLSIFTIFFIVIFIVKVPFVIYTTKQISNPIIALSNSTSMLVKGDLSQKIALSSSKDEIGILTNSYNETLQFLIRIISDLNMNSELLFISANEIAASSQEVSASSEEISAISQQMSKGAQEQVNKVLKSVEEVDNLEKIFQSNISDIKQTSSLIENITSQVNMLALNASIEAARAGEYGRGFTVVAENIRNLAENTRISLSEVNQKITNIELNLSKSIESIKKLIESVSAISEETASGAEEASASTEQQSATMEELSSKSQELTQIAKKLQELVHKFKI
jgi:methyl-accepting chemotaxis protein